MCVLLYKNKSIILWRSSFVNVFEWCVFGFDRFGNDDNEDDNDDNDDRLGNDELEVEDDENDDNCEEVKCESDTFDTDESSSDIATMKMNCEWKRTFSKYERLKILEHRLNKRKKILNSSTKDSEKSINLFFNKFKTCCGSSKFSKKV